VVYTRNRDGIVVLTLEETIEAILKNSSEYDRKDILKLIDDKRKELGPEVVNEESAAMIVARELGIDLQQVSPKARLRIEDITEENRSVTLTAKVVNVGTIRTFSRPGGGEGKVASIIVADETGQIRVALWDEITSVITEGDITVGSVIQIRGSYVKKGLRSALELNLGRMGGIRVLEEDEAKELEIKTAESGTVHVADLHDRMFDVALTVRLDRLQNLSEFKRKTDGAEGKVMNAVGVDDTGSVRVVFWNEHAEQMQGAKEGEVIRLSGAYTKTGRNGEIEVHLGRSGKIERGLKQKIAAAKAKETPVSVQVVGKKNIGDLSLEMKDVDIEGKVAKVFPPTAFERDGKPGKVQNLLVADESGTTRVTFWTDHVDLIKDLQQGDVIRIRHGYIKEGLRGAIEYHVGRRSEIEINPEDSDLGQLDLSEIVQRPAVQAGRMMVGQIGDETEGKTVELCGIIVAVARTSPVYASCPNCRKKTEERDGKYYCAVCGKVDKPEYRMLYKVTLDDGSGSIRATLFGKTGEDLLQMTAQQAQDLIVKSGNKSFPMEQNSNKMLGRYVAVRGRVSKFRDSLEISASELLFADPIEEIKRTREEVVRLAG
jgi:replication factor A1